MKFSHVSVLLEESINGLAIKENGIYVDGTAGGGGHSQEILKHLKEGKLISIDRDPDAIRTISEKFKNEPNSIIINGCFGNMKTLLNERGINEVDGVLLDIGVSSYQLDCPERGFSFHEDAPLDMRMSQKGATAADLVNTLSHGELAKIILTYGEEKFAGSISSAILKARVVSPIKTTLQLAEIIKSAVPQKVRRDGHPARKTFQALRIAVNGELDQLEQGLDDAFALLSKGGRLAVITFHSLEDRIVKNKFSELSQGCVCPKEFPVCVCGNSPKAKIINKKPITATNEELEVNSRSRSAKLRVLEKL